MKIADVETGKEYKLKYGLNLEGPWTSSCRVRVEAIETVQEKTRSTWGRSGTRYRSVRKAHCTLLDEDTGAEVRKLYIHPRELVKEWEIHSQAVDHAQTIIARADDLVQRLYELLHDQDRTGGTLVDHDGRDWSNTPANQVVVRMSLDDAAKLIERLES